MLSDQIINQLHFGWQWSNIDKAKFEGFKLIAVSNDRPFGGAYGR